MGQFPSKGKMIIFHKWLKYSLITLMSYSLTIPGYIMESYFVPFFVTLNLSATINWLTSCIHNLDTGRFYMGSSQTTNVTWLTWDTSSEFGIDSPLLWSQINLLQPWTVPSYIPYFLFCTRTITISFFSIIKYSAHFHPICLFNADFWP